MLDLVIVGGSAAGAAAAVYAARRKLDFKVVAIDLGGEVATSGDVDNYPGIVHTTGVELAQMFQAHMKANEVPIEEGVAVQKIEKTDSGFRVHGMYGSEPRVYETKSIIVATGAHPRHLQVPGEDQLYHRGVTYCTVCDGPLFRNKTTVTIGTGNSALESALMMGQIAKKHYVLAKYPQFKGDAILIEKVTSHPNIEVIYEGMTQRIEGEQMVEAVVYKDATGVEQRIEAQGVFIHIGLVPQSGFIDLVEKTPAGNITIDRLARTSCPGVFAAGDVTDLPYMQIGIASGMGITAALTAINYLNTLEG